MNEEISPTNTNQDSFKLISLKLFRHKILDGLEIDFLEDNNRIDNNRPVTTLLIGPNGSGKSQILRAIINIFRELEQEKYHNKKQNIIECDYVITYKINDKVYKIEKTKKTKYEKKILENDKEIGLLDLKLPTKLIASAFMLNDKFLFVDNLKSKTEPVFYEYIGLRRSDSIAGTKSYLKKVVESIINSSTNPDFIKDLKLILKFLNLTPPLKIYFHPKYRTKIFKGNITGKEFTDFFINWEKHTRRKKENPPRSLNYIKSMKDMETNKLVEFINNLSGKLVQYENSRSYYFCYRIDPDNVLPKETINEFKLIQELMKLDLFTYPSIDVRKENQEFELEEASSGEYHFLSTLIGVLAKIDKNSLVLIDEPEVSLHPNWQIKYIHALKEIFARYNSCHFLIATHSHFMISDLEKESSSIVSLKRDEENRITAKIHPQNTFGWSAEDILYNIFEMRTVRNYYLGEDLRNVLHLISTNSENIQEIKTLVGKFEKLVLNESDPLNLVIKQAKEYVKKNDTTNKSKN